MMYEIDEELLRLKKAAKVNYRDLANVIGLAPNSVAQRFGGFIKWQEGEREAIVDYLKNRIATK